MIRKSEIVEGCSKEVTQQSIVGYIRVHFALNCKGEEEDLAIRQNKIFDTLFDQENTYTAINSHNLCAAVAELVNQRQKHCCATLNNVLITCQAN